jgi:predicted transcriptional regulator
MSKISIVEFEEKHVEDVAKVLAKSFIALNTTWKHYNLPYEEVYRLMRGKILPSLQSLTTFVPFYSYVKVILEDDKLIGVSASYDMFDTLRMPTIPNHI